MAVEILLGVAILLIFAKVFGEIAERLKFSSLLGEITGGIIALSLGLVSPNPLIGELAGFGALFVVFLIGLNTNFAGEGNFKPAAFLGLAGDLLSFALGFLLGYYAFGFEAGLVMGAAILSTSTVITMRSISDLGELHSKAGKMITAINISDEIIAVLALSTVVSYFTLAGETWKIAALFFIFLTTILLVIAFLSKIAGGLLGHVEEMNDDQFIIAIAIVLVFLFSFATNQVGIAGVSGAFLAGLLLNKSSLKDDVIMPKISTISSGFFAPLFFAYASLFIDISTLYGSLGIIAVLLVAGVAAKIVGCGVFSGYYGFRGREKLTVGISMIPRGEFAIILAYIALTMNIITPQVYTVILAFVFLTIFLAPLMLKAFVKQW